MNRRGFLAGLGAVCLPFERPVKAVGVVDGEVQAVLVGTAGRSAPVVFDGRRRRPPFQEGDWIPIPPLDFVFPRAGTVTHLELTAGRRTEIVELDPARAGWEGDRVRVAGLVWRG